MVAKLFTPILVHVRVIIWPNSLAQFYHLCLNLRDPSCISIHARCCDRLGSISISQRKSNRLFYMASRYSSANEQIHAAARRRVLIGLKSHPRRSVFHSVFVDSPLCPHAVAPPFQLAKGDSTFPLRSASLTEKRTTLGRWSPGTQPKGWHQGGMRRKRWRCSSRPSWTAAQGFPPPAGQAIFATSILDLCE